MGAGKRRGIKKKGLLARYQMKNGKVGKDKAQTLKYFGER